MYAKESFVSNLFIVCSHINNQTRNDVFNQKCLSVTLVQLSLVSKHLQDSHLLPAIV